MTTDAQLDRLERILKRCIANSAHRRKESEQRLKEFQSKLKQKHAKLVERQKKTDKAFELLDRKRNERRNRNR